VELASVDDTEWLAREIDVDSAGDGKGHDQRRAHEEVRFHALVDADLEVAISGENADADDVVPGERLFEPTIERSRVADTGGAAERHDVEPQPVEERLWPVLVRYSLTTREPGASEVFTHGLTLSPRSTAFFASKPAASMTAGFDVLVHEVMAAMTTSP